MHSQRSATLPITNLAAINDPILTIGDVATELRCSRAHVYNVINGIVDGVSPLPIIQMGRRKLVRRSTLEHWKQVNEKSHDDDSLRPHE